jgi:hypothetical protein
MRDYRNRADGPVPHVIRRRTCDMLDKILEHRLVEQPRRAVTDVECWQNEIAQLNRSSGF